MDYGMDYQGGGDGAPTPASGRKVKNYDEQTVTPVTIRMINEATEVAGGGGIQLADGRSVHHVRIVAVPRDINETSTAIVYHIEDGTGVLTVKQWADEAGNSAKMQQQETTKNMMHQYIEVVGEVKAYEGQKSLVAQSIAPLKSGNQVTYHMLQVVYSVEQYKRQGSNAAFMPMQGVGFGNNISSGAPIQQQSAGGDGIRNDVLQFIQTNGQEDSGGASIHSCVANLASKYNEAQIRKVFEDLSAEGIIYSTVNEDHFMYAQ